MVFYLNILYCIFFVFECKNDEILSICNYNYYCFCFFLIIVLFVNVFIVDEDLDIGFNGRLSGKWKLNCVN